MKLLYGKLIALFLTIGVVNGNYFELNELIERIHSESDFATICYIGIDGKFLDVFVKKYPNISVVIFQFSLSTITWKSDTRLYGNVLLVIEAVTNDLKYLELLHQLILQLGVRNFAIISAKNFNILQEYFSYFWVHKFRRTFGIANGKSYAHLPFADSPFHKISRNDHLPNALSDLNGFSIRTAIKLDVPRSFWYTDKNGIRKIGGFAGRLFTYFLEEHNATLDSYNFDKRKEIKNILEGALDVSISPYTGTKGIQMSYPIKFCKGTIMVPLRGYLDPNQYFLRSFSVTAWACIGIAFIYIVLMNILMNVSVGLPADVWHSFSQLYLTMLNMSLDQIYQRAYRFQLLQKLFAFILVNFYLVSLASFLTVFIKVKEYNTAADLVDDKFPVLATKYAWELVNKEEYPKDFESIITFIPYDVLIRERNSMKNTSFAYGIGFDAGNYLISLMSKYVKPKFKLLDSNSNTVFFGFLWAKHAPLHAVLSDFVSKVLDTGLMIKWTSDSIEQGAEIIIKNINLRADSYEVMFPLTLRHLDFAWNSLTFGLSAAALVFLVEKYVTVVWKLIKI